MLGMPPVVLKLLVSKAAAVGSTAAKVVDPADELA